MATATATNESDEIRRKMAQIRRDLHEDVREVVAGAEAATNWRRYVRAYPWASVGIAAAVGFLAVPRVSRSLIRDTALKADVAEVRDQLKQVQEAGPVAKEERRASLLARRSAWSHRWRGGSPRTTRWLIWNSGSLSISSKPWRKPGRAPADHTPPEARPATRRAWTGRIQAMYERFQESAASAEPGLEQFRDQAQLYAAAASERLAEGRDKIRQYIVNEPARALGIALGVGVLLGWLIKRR